MAEELLPSTQTILERPYMKFVPFGVDERGERIKDVSGMIVHDNVEYLEEWVTRTKGADAAFRAMDDLCRLLNDRIRDPSYHVTLDQLKNVWNSYSYEFTSYLREFCREQSRDPDFYMNVGREKHISPLIQTLGRPFSLAQIHRMFPYFARKYAKDLEYSVLEVTDTSAVLRMNLTARVFEQFGPYRKACTAQICESTKGRFAMVPPRLHLLPESRVVDRACIVKGDDYCEWEVRWERQARRYSAWPLWGMGAGLATAGLMRLAYPSMSLGEVILAGLIPISVAGMLINRHLRQESQQREALIREQITVVESRHEELRAAYLEQEQTRVELRRKVAQLTALHRAGLHFSSTLDREALMQKVLETLTSDLPYDRVMVSFYDPIRQVVKDARAFGVSPEIQAFVRAREISVTDPMSPEGIVLIQGQPLLIGDLQAVWDRIHPLNQQLALLTKAKALIAVPLKTKDRILGSLTVDRMQEYSLTQDDLELMMTVANQVAIALDNASAYEQIEELNLGLEVKVRERTAELEQADRLRSQFLSHVSHELKTPLTSIKGFLQNLLDGLTGPLNEKQQRYLSRMLDNAERLIRMIEDLLDRTRIQSGRLDLVPSEIDLGHCVGEAVEQLRLLAQAKRQTLDVVVPPVPLMVWADRDRLIQIVTNLLQNAVKFTPEGGSILVTVRQENQMLAGVSVRDTGPGISPEFLDQIFDPFFRVKQARSGTKGLGLGLSIVRTLVELQGGTIVAKSEPGQGAELSFTIPLLPAPAAPLAGTSAESPRILIVEDDPDIRQLLQDRLRARGYRVHLEVDGVRALEAVRAETFEGMILDIGIPSMDGMDVLRQIRRWDQQIPIVMVTASGSKELAIRAIGMGAQAHVLKPFDIDELERIVDCWFRSSEQRSPESSVRPVVPGE